MEYEYNLMVSCLDRNVERFMQKLGRAMRPRRRAWSQVGLVPKQQSGGERTRILVVKPLTTAGATGTFFGFFDGACCREDLQVDLAGRTRK